MRKGTKWIIIISGVVLFIGLLRTFLFTTCYIPSKGMEDNLKQGDRIIINKWSYGLRVPFSQKRIAAKHPQKGDIILFNNPADTISKDISNKEYFINTCIGLPGDTLYVDSLFLAHHIDSYFNPDEKIFYQYPKAIDSKLDSISTQLNIQQRSVLGSDKDSYIKSFTPYEYYLLKQYLTKKDSLEAIVYDKTKLYPLIIPKAKTSIKIEPWNLILIYNTILLHEKEDIKLKDGVILLNNKPIDNYSFSQDYYWMTSNNCTSFMDSRQYGFVPYTHIIGKACYIWFSKDPNKNIISGYRWDRILKSIY